MWYVRARHLGSAVLLGALAACSRAPLPETVTADPEMVDYGAIDTFPVPFHRAQVRLVNGTATSHVVKDIETSDGIMVDMASGAVLPGHGEGELVITLDGRDRPGEYAGEVKLLWEDDHPPLRIPVRASIVDRQRAMSAEGPNLVIDGPADWDFGTIQRQAIEYFDFYVKNTGTEPVVLQSIETKCGCVQGWADERTIPPGGRLPIHARVTASVYPGNHPQKTITIVSNDPDTPITSLFVHGFIQDAFTIEPSPVDFGEVEPGTSAEREIVVRAHRPNMPKVGEIIPSVDFITIERHPDAEENNVVAAATIRLKADAPPGPFDVRVRFEFPTDHNAPIALADPEVPVRGTVGGALPVLPTSVNFGIVEAGGSFVRRVRVFEVTDPQALHVDCQLNYLSATVEPEEDGLMVILRYEPTQGEGAVVGQVIMTDTRSQRSRTIPVALQFSAPSKGDAPAAGD